MKQQEKTQKTRERILSAAIKEFGTKSYDTASVNAICNEGGIPKGLFYHNFQNKDAIYLECVKICFEQMTEYQKLNSSKLGDSCRGLQELLFARQKFFSENPDYANIFFNCVLQPPKHLVQNLWEIRKPFDDFCTACYRKVLSRIPLRKGVTEKAALEYFSAFTEVFNGYYQRKADSGIDYRTMIEEHEGRLLEMLDIILYGIAVQERQEGSK